MNHDEISERLRALGQRPIDSGTQERHRDLIGATRPGAATAPRRRFSPVAVAAAGVVGFLAGSTGLAMAGALPDTAQDVAHDVLSTVQVDVPRGKEGTRGACMSEAAKIDDEADKQAAKDACPAGGREGSRGSCMSEAAKIDDEADKQAAKDACPAGKPDQGDDADADRGKSGDAPGQAKDKTNAGKSDDPCRGKPAWAGKMTPEDRAAAKRANPRDACPEDSETETEDADVDDDQVDLD